MPLVSKEDELSSIINRRVKRLVDLYLVVSSESPIPLSHAADSEHHQRGLALFLEQNDLTKGHYFDEATLPRRPNYASVVASTRPAPAAKQLSATSPLKPFPSRSPAKANAALPLTPISSDPRSELSNGHHAPSHSHAGERVQDAHLVGASHRSGATISDSQNTSQASITAPSTPQPEEPSVTSSTFGKPSAPASPPYSPGTQASRVGGIHIDGPQQMPDGAVNVLTPRGDSQDGMPSSRRTSLAEQTPVKEYDSAKTLNTDVPPPKLAQESDKSLDDLVASAAVEAPPPGTEVPANSEAELARDMQPAQTKDLDPMSKVEAQVDSATTDDEEQRHNELASKRNLQGTQEGQDFAGPSSTLAPSAISVVSENNLRTDSDGLLPPPKQKNSEKAKTRGGPEKLQEEVFAKQQESMPKDRRERSLTPMEVDQVQPEVLNTSRPPVLKPRQSAHRVRKPKHRARRRKTFVLASAKDERHLEIARHLRKNQGFPEYGSTAYFKPMLKRIILQQNGFKTMDDLVRNNSKKSVNTSDHLVAIREEVDFRVLERVRRMQSLEGRWTYKHPARAQEPEPQVTHWDLLLKDAKWLRTDFREERKLKVAVARELAEWCAEWVEADAETRKSLQVQVKTASKGLTSAAVQLSGEDVPSLSNDEDDISEDDMLDFDRPASKRLKLDRSLFLSIPEYGVKPAYKDSISTLRAVASADVDLEDSRLPTLITSGKAAQGLLSTVIEANAKPPEIKPEDVTCALFNPESKPLRARLNAPWAFKPPSVSMPPQAFFEHRNASQWTWEDDQMLKQYAKDFPSNWTLIADRLTSRSLFNSYVDRRTPWECYERLLGMEGPPADAQAKQYLRHFHTRIERAKETFDAHQATIREHTEQQARNTGQPVPNLQPKRFPAPLRVDRKPNKRLVAILDGARKMAKKREIAALKSQQSAATSMDQQPRPPPPPGARVIHTPQYWSRVKWERDQRELERANTMREQQRQLQEQQRRQVAAGLPVQMVNGAVPQVRPPGFVPPQGVPTGITGMPNLANVQNPAQRQVIQQVANANAMAGMSAQAMAINNRTVAAQAQLAGAQRLAPQMAGNAGNNDSMRRMLALQQNNAMFNQQQMQAGQQLQRQASGNGTTAVNGMSNAAMLNQFGNPPMRSPGLPQQQQQNGPAVHASPHAQQATVNRMQPHSLANGHVPPIVTLQNQVRAANPNMTDTEINHIAGEQLKQFMAQSQSRQNAISASAAGNMNRANGNINSNNFSSQQQQQQLQNGNMYSPASNMLGTPQQRAAANQAAQTRNAGSPPNQAANLLATPTQQRLQQAQSQAQAQLNGQPTGQQSQYSAQIRQQMYNLQRMQQTNNMNGNGATPTTNGNHRSPNPQQISPAAGFAMPVNANAAAGFQRPNGPTTPAAVQQGSMRPPSRTPSSMGVNAQGQHLSPQQQLAQMQRSISNSGGQQQATPQMMQRTMSNGQGRGGMHAQMQRTVSGSGGNGYPMQAMGMGSVSPMPQGMSQQHVQGMMQGSGGKMGGQ